MKIFGRAFIALSCVLSGGSAHASETVRYTYDVLGRLTATATVGGPNSGTNVAAGFDPAGNRTGYAVSGSQAMTVPGPQIVTDQADSSGDVDPVGTDVLADEQAGA